MQNLDVNGFIFVLQLSGLVVGGIGIWTVISKHSYVSLMTTSTYPTLAYALIVAGVLAVVGSWLGCGGVTSENRCVLLIVSNRQICTRTIRRDTGMIWLH